MRSQQETHLLRREEGRTLEEDGTDCQLASPSDLKSMLERATASLPPSRPISVSIPRILEGDEALT